MDYRSKLFVILTAFTGYGCGLNIYKNKGKRSSSSIETPTSDSTNKREEKSPKRSQPNDAIRVEIHVNSEGQFQGPIELNGSIPESCEFIKFDLPQIKAATFDGCTLDLLVNEQPTSYFQLYFTFRVNNTAQRASLLILPATFYHSIVSPKTGQYFESGETVKTSISYPSDIMPILCKTELVHADKILVFDQETRRELPQDDWEGCERELQFYNFHSNPLPIDIIYFAKDPGTVEWAVKEVIIWIRPISEDLVIPLSTFSLE